MALELNFCNRLLISGDEIHPQPSIAPPLDVDCLLSTFEYLIQLDVQRGILQHDDVTHRRYLHSFNEVIGIAALTSGYRGSSVGNMLEPRDNAISLE
jgi:hypothetical protein